MKIAEIFDNLDEVNGRLHANLVEHGLEHMLIGSREISVTRWRKGDADYDWCKYDASILVGTPNGLIVELATEFSDLAEGWPARIDRMTSSMTTAVTAIAGQATQIRRRRNRLQTAAKAALASMRREGLELERISVSLQRIWVSQESWAPNGLEVNFVVEIMMPKSVSELDSYTITVSDADDLDAYLGQTLMPELRRRAARLAA